MQLCWRAAARARGVVRCFFFLKKILVVVLGYWLEPAAMPELAPIPIKILHESLGHTVSVETYVGMNRWFVIQND